MPRTDPTPATQTLEPMKLSPKRIKSSKRKVPRFLLPLALCLFPFTFYLLPSSPPPAVAQTIDARQAEADRLLQQGIQQYQTSQFQAALNSWQQTLQIYRALKNRGGEGRTLGSLGAAYGYLGNYAKAIEYTQQHTNNRGACSYKRC